MNSRIDILSRALATLRVSTPVGRTSTSSLRSLHTTPRLCAAAAASSSPSAPPKPTSPPKIAASTSSVAPTESTHTAPPSSKSIKPPKTPTTTRSSSSSQKSKSDHLEPHKRPYTGSNVWSLSRALVRIDHAVSPNKIERLTYILTRSYPLLRGLIKKGRPAYIFIEGPTPKLHQFVQRLSILQLFNSTETLEVNEVSVSSVAEGGGEKGEKVGGRKWLEKGDAWCVVDDVKLFKNRLKGLDLGLYGVKAFEDEEKVLKKVHRYTKAIGKRARRERARAYEAKKKEMEGKKEKDVKKDGGKKKEKEAVRRTTVEKLAAM